jgi:hypothetical protein
MEPMTGIEPPRFPAETACEMRFVDPGVVTRAVVVLEICADVLRHVTVLAPVDLCRWVMSRPMTVAYCSDGLKHAGQATLLVCTSTPRLRPS